MKPQENLSIVPTQNSVRSFAIPSESDSGPSLDLDKHLIAHPAATFLWRCGSDWPEFEIRRGDLLVVDRAWEPWSGLLALGVCEGNFCLGRLQRMGLGWSLELQPESELEIWGVVCHVIRQLV